MRRSDLDVHLEIRDAWRARAARWALRLSFALVLSLGAVSGALAAAAASYAQGMEALDNEQWAEAADWFRKAIEEQPQAGGKMPVGRKKRPYLPYHHLGLALYRADALREASDAWRESALQGAVTPKMRKEIDRHLFDIEDRLARATTAESPSAAAEPEPEPEPELSAEDVERRRTGARRQLERAERRSAALDQPHLQAVLEADESLRALRDQGLEKLRQAREIFNGPGQNHDPAALTDVHERAVAAADILTKVVLSASRQASTSQEEGEGK